MTEVLEQALIATFHRDQRERAARARSRWSRLNGLAHAALVLTFTAALTPAAHAVEKPAKSFVADPKLVQLDLAINWTDARLIAVQDGGRYKTLDSFARESLSAMYGKEHLPDLSPIASLLEWLFNRDAYADVPLIRVKDKGVQIHFTAHMTAQQAQRIRSTGYMTFNEFTSRTVEQRKDELRPRAHMGPAMGRVNAAEGTAVHLERLFRIVPRPEGPRHELWLTPAELVPNLPVEYHAGTTALASGQRLPGISEDTAVAIVFPWASLRTGWLERDAQKVNDALAKLTERLPQIAAGAETPYPALAQRKAEAHYYAFGKFTWGWMAYLIGSLASVWVLVTRWRWSFLVAQVFLLIGLAIHAYGIGLRWMIVGHVPVANMFEAVTASAWLGITLLLGIELTDRFRVGRGARIVLGSLYGVTAAILGGYATAAIWFKSGQIHPAQGAWFLAGATFLILGAYAYLLISALRGLPQMFYRPSLRPVFLLAASMTGFFALMLAHFVIPGSGTLTGIRMILDDVMLRVHTVLIISSYALIFLGAVIAITYLFGYYFQTARAASAEVGGIVSLTGAVLLAIAFVGFAQLEGPNDNASGYVKAPYLALPFWIAAGMSAIAALLSGVFRAPRIVLASLLVLLVACVTIAIGDRGFVLGMGWILLIGGALWGGGNLLGILIESLRVRESAPALELAGAGAAGMHIGYARAERPILAGGAPGDEHNRKLPQWLHDFDWCHLIILNLVFVMLFVGTVLGAVWADYSWGRPWGWDPKEVFALNTWIVYAILIHARFAFTNKGLWTAWLSVAGALMMAFNWCFVNFYIVGLHSYA